MTDQIISPVDRLDHSEIVTINRRWTVEQLTKMRDKCQSDWISLGEEAIQLEEKILVARINSDDKTLVESKTLLRQLGLRRQICQLSLGRISHALQLRAKQRDEQALAFVKAARKILDRDKYLEIWKYAQVLLDEWKERR
jgi:hypothetical protein